MLNIQLKKDEFIKGTWFIFIFLLIIDMGGGIGLKNLAFAILILSIIFLFLCFKIKINLSTYLIEFYIFFICPLLLIGYSTLFLKIPLSNQIPQVTAFITFFSLLLATNLKNKDMLLKSIEKIAIVSACGIIFTFLGIYTLHIIGMDSVIYSINSITNTFNMGYIGINPLGNQIGLFLPNVYYVWSLLLIPFTLILIKRSKFNFIISIIACIMTLSTGVVLFVMIGILLITLLNMIFSLKIKLKLRYVIYSIVIGILTFSMLNMGIADLLFSKLNIYSNSSSTKIGHIQSALKEIFATPFTFLFGMGLGSSFYSIGAQAEVVNIEVSHFNLIRQFGILYFCIFLLYILNLIYEASKIDFEGKKIAVGLLMLFIAAGTNPLLISPVFFIWLVITKSYIILSKKGERL
ncbi:hypothetical protein MKX47_02980 [Solibacillus sp. FSL R7-0668]|uniref:hypothetical protein n=1 Tax=Solibacillus sp. FSL R7-0668 TaxID=2921688 RepID=UPI0030F59C5A